MASEIKVDTVSEKTSGSGVTIECLSNMQNAVKVPVSIKCRLGVDNHESYEFLHNFISTVKDSGTKIFVIHARNGILNGLSPRQNRNVPDPDHSKGIRRI